MLNRAARKPLRLLFATCVSLLAWGAARAASLPFTPSPVARHAIELLIDEAGLPLTSSQWPLPSEAVEDALDQLPTELPGVLEEARWHVRDELDRAQRAGLHWRLETRGLEMPTAYGREPDQADVLQWDSPTWHRPEVAARLGLRLESRPDGLPSDSRLQLDGSAVAAEWEDWQIQAWQRRSWWGPGWQNALALSNNAPALVGAGVQRATTRPSELPVLKWLGPWNYELFLAQTDGVDARGNPYLIGHRLTFRPLPSLELGLTQMVQWGGLGRPSGLHSLVEALLGRTNVSDDQVAEDPANLLAGYDLRWRCPAGWGCAVYGQLIGEDEAGGLPSRFLSQLGTEWTTAEGRQRWSLEYLNTYLWIHLGEPSLRGATYRNRAYPMGYTSQGRWLGANAGPDTQLWSLGWLDMDSGWSFQLNQGRVGSRIGRWAPLAGAPAASGRLTSLAVQRQWQGADWHWDAGFKVGHQDRPAGGRWAWDATLAAEWTWREGATGAGDGLARAWPDLDSPWTQGLAGLGLLALSTAADRPLDAYAERHGHNPSAKALKKLGSVLPMVALGSAGWVVLGGPMGPGEPLDDRSRYTAQASLWAGGAALLTTEALKLAVGRSRPSQGHGPWHSDRQGRLSSSFPSMHSALAWAAVTPWAEQTQQPWLYALPALTSMARVMGRQHWVSDTVAGGLVGYAWGRWMAEAGVGPEGRGPLGWHLSLGLDGVQLTAAW